MHGANDFERLDAYWPVRQPQLINFLFSCLDLDGMRADCLHGSQTGFTSKCAIHPTHVGIANEVFSPAQDRIDWARGLLEASERHKQQGEVWNKLSVCFSMSASLSGWQVSVHLSICLFVCLKLNFQ